jgi:hypothetical protein
MTYASCTIMDELDRMDKMDGRIDKAQLADVVPIVS